MVYQPVLSLIHSAGATKAVDTDLSAMGWVLIYKLMLCPIICYVLHHLYKFENQSVDFIWSFIMFYNSFFFSNHNPLGDVSGLEKHYHLNTSCKPINQIRHV